MANEEIEISELEFTEELAGDNLIPVESLSDTKATSLQILKNWLGSFFVGLAGNQEIGGVKTFSSSPILTATTGNRVAVFNANKQLVSDSNVSTTEISYLDGLTGNVQTQLNEKAKTDFSNVSSSLDYVTEKGTYYMKFKSGKQICWGSGTTKGGTVTLPKAFGESTYSVTLSGVNTASGSQYGIYLNTQTTTNFKVKWYGSAYSKFYYIAVGKGA